MTLHNSSATLLFSPGCVCIYVSERVFLKFLNKRTRRSKLNRRNSVKSSFPFIFVCPMGGGTGSHSKRTRIIIVYFISCRLIMEKKHIVLFYFADYCNIIPKQIMILIICIYINKKIKRHIYGNIAVVDEILPF